LSSSKLLVFVIASSALLWANLGRGQSFRLIHTEEASITDIHQALESGIVTCRELVQIYLDRIEAYDKKGPALNAIVTLNPRALDRAREMDMRISHEGITQPLQCIPFIVKDNYDTADLPTTAGSLSLKDSHPPDDAFQVRKIRDAGAIVIAKSNMAEFAFSPYETLSSILPGHTRNPYALDRVPAGSSGGTAAAVAANFGAVGLGTDTGNSIRGPSSHNCLVGIRSTMGLTSRDGIVPLNLYRDVGGPMARTVADAVQVFEVIAGPDPADPATAPGQGRKPDGYVQFLTRDGLRGARIGVLRQISNTDTADPDILRLFDRAIQDMRDAGAEIVDPLEIPALDELRGTWCNRFKFDINSYLASLGPEAPVKNLEEILSSRRFHPSIHKRLVDAQAVEGTYEETCREAQETASRLREALGEVFENQKVDALVYPTWSNPPRLLGDLNTPHGDNSQRPSPPTGFPAITVPMGFSYGRYPAGLQFLGKAWGEPTLIRLAYAYEQRTRHRRPPTSTPPLGGAARPEEEDP
jgi:Asp-tRNA(Asn)/Glu-tRNA(Gln) amidotransferase A subunit family amidase